MQANFIAGLAVGNIAECANDFVFRFQCFVLFVGLVEFVLYVFELVVAFFQLAPSGIGGDVDFCLFNQCCFNCIQVG